ncbi:unnamed protein product [Sphagnum jensenii]|uniref:Alcohol dehydrogenase-like N-terminal domain-containing protein n=1 Tax=Sphagnum jensenii TaxID=128206 RepID=A0ABP1BEM8_9BRYO
MAPGVEVRAWAARDNSGHLSPFTFSRRATGPGDVKFKILFCGVCHSDLHQILNDWGSALYPLVPGHAIVGEVTEVGSEVKAFKVREIVGVGCMVNLCQTCDSCTCCMEQYCIKGLVWTYTDKDYDGTVPQGGYSTIMVCSQEFVLKMPTNLPLDAAAPLLCAGITVYGPMKHYQMDVPGKHFGVVGLGGVGHMAVKFGKAFAAHPLDRYLSTLKIDDRLVVVGIPDKPLSINALSLINAQRDVGGSAIGGIKETQEMLDFCGKHNITCMIEKIPMSYINTAMERLSKSDVKYCFVIYIASTLEYKD